MACSARTEYYLYTLFARAVQGMLYIRGDSIVRCDKSTVDIKKEGSNGRMWLVRCGHCIFSVPAQEWPLPP